MHCVLYQRNGCQRLLQATYITDFNIRTIQPTLANNIFSVNILALISIQFTLSELVPGSDNDNKVFIMSDI